MTNIKDIVYLIKNNPDMTPYLKEIDYSVDLAEELYREKIDITKYLSDSFNNLDPLSRTIKKRV